MQYYSIREVADMFGVHERTIRNWIDSGILYAIKITGGRRGGVIRIPHSAIEKLERESEIRKRIESEVKKYGHKP